MAAEWLTAAILIGVLSPSFGHFETVRPMWTRIVRWMMYLAVTAVLGVTVGRPWTFVWLLGLPLAGATFHVAWCLRHGIGPLTAEPREKYEQLRRVRGRKPETLRTPGA